MTSIMNSMVLMTRLVRQSARLRPLLSVGDHLPTNTMICRSLNLWKEKTLRAMYWRSKDFNAVKRPLDPRSVRQEWNLRAELFAFNQRLHEQWSEDSLKIAFTHHSYVDKEMRQREQLGVADVSIILKDNNSFIQMGQNICESYIKSYLRHFLPRLPEDGVCALHDYLVSDEVLSDVAKWIGCIDLILCEELPPNETTLANTTKALIGAAAADHTDKRAENFVLDFVITYLMDKDILEIWDIPNPRFQLNGILKREKLSAPEYRLLGESATGTIESCYIVGIYVAKQLIGSAPGETIEIAKQMADLDALRRLFRLTPSEVLLKFGPKAYGIDLSASTKETLYLNEWAPSALNTTRFKTKQIQ